MHIDGLDPALELHRLGAALPIWRAQVKPGQWLDAALHMAQSGARLVALWGSDRSGDAHKTFAVNAAYATPRGLAWLDLALDPARPAYPSVADEFPFAGRMQRAIADLLGFSADGFDAPRPWLDHGTWPAGYFPLRRGSADAPLQARPAQDYPFVRGEGDGVHEFAGGPVHAGIIEPGHFRFSVVGEKVLRLEERLGYTHMCIKFCFLCLFLFV